MRKAEIYYIDILAGILAETDDGEYVFQYIHKYVKSFPNQFITFSMPVTTKPYVSNRLFPFFEELIPDGWLLDIASKNWKLNPNDRMGLLLACWQNCISAVHVKPIPANNEE
jgi:serine/threonine-protein kinase HipA